VALDQLLAARGAHSEHSIALWFIFLVSGNLMAQCRADPSHLEKPQMKNAGIALQPTLNGCSIVIRFCWSA
jgi:hypothetical protein